MIAEPNGEPWPNLVMRDIPPLAEHVVRPTHVERLAFVRPFAETATIEAKVPGVTRGAGGAVTMIENTVDPGTGMVQVRATMPNADWRETLDAVVWTLFDFYRDEPGFRVLWFSRFQSGAMMARNRQLDLAGVGRAYERMHNRGLELVGVDPEHALHLVIGIIDKGLDLSFLIDPDGDRDIIEQTIVAAIAYLERYAADMSRRR